ncbi:MAG TPA: histidine phosphatase family protein [Polyangiaceae bacterium]
MRTLLLLRHAKSSWAKSSWAKSGSGPELDDFDRPLNERGRAAAPLMGRLLVERGLVPDVILCSSARRAVQTLCPVVDESRFAGTIVITRELYLVDPSAVVELIRRAPPAERLMVISHNPTLEALHAAFSGRHEPFPTAALGRYDLGVAGFAELGMRAPVTHAELFCP